MTLRGNLSARNFPSKNNRLWQKICAITLSTLISALPLVSQGNPVGGQVIGGEATISHPDANKVQINQSSDRAIVNWESYNVAQGEQVNYQQPNSSSVTLNRINPNNGPAQIFGQITANGQVWLSNPAGIWFGPTAHVDVAGLLATTASISNQDFMAGRYRFLQEPGWNGSIINDGEIIVREAGLAALVGNGVVNNGRITAQLGTVVLGAGTEFTVDFAGDQLIQFAVGGDVTQPANDQHGNSLPDVIKNSGAIIANGGRVIMTAKAAGQVLDNAINMTGVAVAKSVAMKNGEIILSGGDGTIRVSGKLIASGKKSGQTGGTVKVLADRVALTDNALVDVSGDAAGGIALIGGNAHGLGNEQTASYAFVGPNATIKANAINQGNGGKVVIWSNLGTKYFGSIYAKGGAVSGNGGFVEVSGKEYLGFDGIVDTTAAFGQTGTLLLDPKFLIIATSGGAAYDGVTNLFANNASGTTTLTPASINTAAGTNDIILQANSDVIFTNTLTINSVGSSGRTLTVQAGRSILINASITTNNGAISMTANDTAADSSNRSTTSSGNPAGDTETVNGNITQATGTTISSGTADSTYTINSTSNGTFTPGSITVYGLTGNNISLTSPNNISLNATVTAGAGATLTLTAGGSISQPTGTLTGLSLIAKTLNNSGGAISLDTVATNNFTNIDLRARNAADSANVAGAIAYRDTNAVTVAAANTTSTVTLTASGVLDQTGAMTGSILTAKTRLTAGAAITLTNTSNEFSTVSLLARNAGDTANAPGAIQYVDASGFDIAFTGANTAGIASTSTVTLTASDAITQSSGNSGIFGTTLTVKTLKNGGAAITLNNSANALTTIDLRTRDAADSANAAGAITYVDTNGVAVAAANTTSSVDLTAGATITQTGAMTGTSLTAKTLSAGTANITLNIAGGNEFSSINLVARNATDTANAVGAINYTDATGFDIAFTGANTQSLATTGALTLTSTGSITQNDTTANNAIVIGGTTTIASGTNDITLNNANNDFTGAVTFTNGNNVTIQDANALSIAASTISGNLTATSGTTLTATGALTLNGTTSTFASTTNDNITFNSTVNGPTNLVVNTTGTTTFTGRLGATTALTSVTTNAGGTTNINGGGSPTVNTTGAQIYNDTVALGANSVFTTVDNNVTFGAGITNAVARNLTINAGTAGISFTGDLGTTLLPLNTIALNSTGTTTIGGAVYSNSTFTTNAGGSTIINGGTITTTSTQTYNDPVTLGANTSLTTTGSTDVIFSAANGATINSDAPGTPRNLTITTGSTGAITLGGTVGGTNALGVISLVSAGVTTLTGNITAASLATNGSGTTSIGATSIQTSGNQIYDGVTLTTAGKNLTSSAGSITFTSTLNGAFALTLSGNTGVIFNGVVGTTVASLDVSGDTEINANVTTTGTQSYHNPVTLGGDITFATTNNAVTFDSTINNKDSTARDLTISAGSGSITITGNVGAGANGALDVITLNATGTTTLSGTLAATSLTTNTGGTTVLNGGTITTSGSQVYNDAVSLGGNTTLNSTASGAISFASTLDSSSSTARTLALNTAGTTTFTGIVGGTNALASLTTDSGGSTTITGASITTSDTAGQVFNDAVSLNVATVTLNANNAGAITFGSTLNSISATARSLVLNTSGTTTFSGAVGTTFPLSALTTDSGGSTAINGGSVSTAGTQTYNDTVSLGQATTFTATAAGVSVLLANSANNFTATPTFTTSGAGTFTTISLTNASTSAVFPVLSATPTNLTLNFSGRALSLPALTLGGTLTVTAGGNLTQSGALVITGVTTVSAPTFNITLDNTSNNFSTLGITSAANATIYDSNAFILATSTVTNTLNLTTGGTITQSGVATGTTLIAKTLSAGTANITLSIAAGNEFAAINLLARNLADTANAAGAINYKDATGFNIAVTGTNTQGIGTTGALTLTSSGAITQNDLSASNAIVSGTTVIASGSTNNITLNNANNNFTSMGITSGLNVSISDIDALSIAASTVSGNYTLTAGGALSDAGDIHVTSGTLTTTSVGGTVFNRSGNEVSQFNATNSGSGSIQLTTSNIPLTITGFSQAVSGSATFTNTTTINIANGVTLNTHNAAVNITATDLNMNSSGAINSGTAATTITQNAASGILGLGAASGDMSLSESELQRITAGAVSFVASGSSAQILVDNVTAASLPNVSGTKTLTANNGSITFQGSASTFTALTASAASAININKDLTITNGTGSFTVTAGTLSIAASATLATTNTNAITIVANDLDLQGAINSTGTTSTSIDITNNGAGTLLSLGNSAGAGMVISGAELQRMTTTGGLTLSNVSNNNIVVDGISSANSANITGTVILDATTGTTGAIVFQNNASSFRTLTGTADTTITINAGVTTSVGALTLTASSGAFNVNSSVATSVGNISLTASSGTLAINSSVTSAGTLTLTSTAGSVDIGASGAVTTTAGALTISANNLILNGTVNSGSNTTTITQNSSGVIVLGDAAGGTMTISGAELQRITANALAINTSADGNILVDNITSANSANIAGTTTLTATAGTTGFITFLNNSSTFTHALTLNTDNVITINNVTLATNNAALTLTASDLDMGTTGALNSGTATLSITKNATGSLITELGNPTGTSGRMGISGSELQRMTANDFTLTAANNGQILVDGITSANTANIAGTFTLSAQTGTLGSIAFNNHSSSFNNLTALADNGITVSSSSPLTTTVGNMLLNGNSDGGVQGSDNVTLSANLISAGSLTLSAATNGVILATPITLTANGITFTDPVNGANTLTLNPGTGSATFQASVGGTTPLSSLTINGSTFISTTGITTSGAQNYNAAVTLTANTTLTTTNSPVTFTSTIDRNPGTANNLTINAGSGAINISGNIGAGSNGQLGVLTLNSTGTTTIGGTVLANGLVTNAGGTTVLNGGSVGTSAATGQSYNDAVLLGADTTFITSGDNVSFASTIDSANSTARSLTLSTGAGIITFGAAVGATNALNDFTVSNTGATNDIVFANNVITVGNINVTAGRSVTLSSGSLLSSGTVSLTGSNGSVQETSTGRISANALSTNSTTGTILNAANTVNSFTATNNSNGDINLTNTASLLTINSITQSASGGAVIINNTGALTTSGLISSTNGGVTLLTLTPDNSARILTINGNVQTNGGAFSATSANPSNITAALIVNGVINTSPGSGGTLVIGRGLELNASPIVGTGNLTLQGNGLDLTLGTVTFNNSVAFEVNRYIIINGVVTTTGAGSNLSLIGDSVNSGVGGVLINSTGSLVSAGNLLIQGSSLAGLAGANQNVGIEIQTGATLQAAGSMTFTGNLALGEITMTAPAGATFGNSGNQVNLGGALSVVTNNSPILFNAAIVGNGNNLTLNSGSGGNITLNADTNVNNFTVVNANNFTNNATINATTFLQQAGNVTNLGTSTLNVTGNATITANTVIGKLNVGSLTLNVSNADLTGTVGGKSGLAAIALINFGNAPPDHLFFDNFDMVATQTAFAMTNEIAALNSYYARGITSVATVIEVTNLVNNKTPTSPLLATTTLTGYLSGLGLETAFANFPMKLTDLLKNIPARYNNVNNYLPTLVVTKLISTLKNIDIPVSPLFLFLLAIASALALIKQLRKEQTIDVVNSMAQMQEANYETLLSMPFKLRTALNNIIGFTSLFNEGAGKISSEIRDYLSNMLYSANDMLQTVKRISSDAQVGSDQIEILLPSESLDNLSFKFRTALNTVLGFAELIKNQKANQISSAEKEYLDNILASTNDMLLLVGSMPEISSSEWNELAMAYKKETLEELSFELRTSTNNIIGFAELIYNGQMGEVTLSQKECIRNILYDSTKMLQLIEDISNLAVGRNGLLANSSEKKLFHILSFELRTILNDIIGFTELANHDLAQHPSPTQQQFLENIRFSSRNIMQLIPVKS